MEDKTVIVRRSCVKRAFECGYNMIHDTPSFFQSYSNMRISRLCTFLVSTEPVQHYRAKDARLLALIRFEVAILFMLVYEYDEWIHWLIDSLRFR